MQNRPLWFKTGQIKFTENKQQVYSPKGKYIATLFGRNDPLSTVTALICVCITHIIHINDET